MQRKKEDFIESAKQSWSIAEMCRNLGLKPLAEILVVGSYYQSYKLKKRLLDDGLKQGVCECCGLNVWRGQAIPLELHHINGNNRDNRLENLLVLCPNCHALTDTYRGKNKSYI